MNVLVNHAKELLVVDIMSAKNFGVIVDNRLGISHTGPISKFI